MKGFFKGLTPRIMSNSPACAISWGTYEVCKFFMIKNLMPRASANKN